MKKKMMTHGIGATITLVWWFIILVVLRPAAAAATATATAVKDSSKEQVVVDLLGNFPTETLDLTASGTPLARSYSQFLARLRSRMAATTSCDIPVTRSDRPAGSEYVLVDLQARTSRSVTLALQVNDLYVIAYRVGGQTSGVFLNEVNVQEAKSKLFSRLKTQETLRHSSSYLDLSKAGASRSEVSLGLLELRNRVEAIHRGETSSVEKAKFLLVAIQIVAEATRFKTIESRILRDGLTTSFTPSSNDEMLAYENNWETISKAVHKSRKQVPNQCVSIRPSIKIGTNTLTLVSDIRDNVMGILKYEGNNKKPNVVGDNIIAATDAVADLEIAFLEDSLM